MPALIRCAANGVAGLISGRIKTAPAAAKARGKKLVGN
jgi:hypothetical protein